MAAPVMPDDARIPLIREEMLRHAEIVAIKASSARACALVDALHLLMGGDLLRHIELACHEGLPRQQAAPMPA